MDVQESGAAHGGAVEAWLEGQFDNGERDYHYPRSIEWHIVQG